MSQESAKYVEILKLLIEYGADPCAPDKVGFHVRTKISVLRLTNNPHAKRILLCDNLSLHIPFLLLSLS